MKEPDGARQRVYGRLVGGEDEHPGPVVPGMGVFAIQSGRECDAGEVVLKPRGMFYFQHSEVAVQRLGQRMREGHAAILVSLAGANGNYFPLEVQVFDAEGEAFGQPQTASVEQGSHESGLPFEAREESGHFFFGENHREACGSVRTKEVNVGERSAEDVPVEEEDGLQSLVLCRGRHMALVCEKS